MRFGGERQVTPAIDLEKEHKFRAWPYRPGVIDIVNERSPRLPLEL